MCVPENSHTTLQQLHASEAKLELNDLASWEAQPTRLARTPERWWWRFCICAPKLQLTQVKTCIITTLVYCSTRSMVLYMFFFYSLSIADTPHKESATRCWEAFGFSNGRVRNLCGKPDGWGSTARVLIPYASLRNVRNVIESLWRRNFCLLNISPVIWTVNFFEMSFLFVRFQSNLWKKNNENNWRAARKQEQIPNCKRSERRCCWWCLENHMVTLNRIEYMISVK